MRTLFTEIGVALLVLALLGCRQGLPPNKVTRSATAVATALAPTKAEYLRQFCTAGECALNRGVMGTTDQ